MSLTPTQQKTLRAIERAGQLGAVKAKLRDCRWVEWGTAADEFRIHLGNDRRILMYREDNGINVGALDGDRAVWDYVPGDFPDAEQAALDCFQALCVLEDVRIEPTIASKSSAERVRRKIRRQFLRALYAWTLVVFGYVVGAALVVLALLSWMLFL